MNTLPKPPAKFRSWLDYAVATIDVRSVLLDRIFEEGEAPSREEIKDAVLAEFNHLKRKALMPWISVQENWQFELSKKLGRAVEDIDEGCLLSSDFSNDSVHIHFADGTDLKFQRAFYVGDVPVDGSGHRVAVFTEHCGYHEFWIGPGDGIAQSGPRAP